MKKYISVLTMSFLLFVNCDRNHLSEAEVIFGYPLKNKVSYKNSHEHWNSFNGNGYKIEIYSISDIEFFKNNCRDNRFKMFDSKSTDNPLGNTDYSEFIENGAGFYKTIWSDNEIRTIVIDVINYNFLYCHIIM